MEKRLRVAYTLEQCWHKVPGGTAVAGIEIARAIAARDEVELVGVAARHPEPPPAEWSPPIPVKHLHVPRRVMYQTWHRFRWPSVDRATGRVDVIHATSIAMPPKSAPLVVTIHDLAFMNDPKNFTKRGVRFFRRGLRIAWREADLVLCPSTATIEQCRKFGFEMERLRLVPMGVDVVPATDPQIAEVKRRYKLERPYILWAGTIEPRKNLPRLLRAYGTMKPEQELVLVGPRGWNENIERLLAGQRPDIKVLGFLPPDDLRALYAGADAFCFPSLEEGFGLPVLEAMAQGTPVVTSLGTSTEELGRDAAVLVDPRRWESIQKGLETVLGDAALRERLKVAGKERAGRYSWDRTAQLCINAYREVTA